MSETQAVHPEEKVPPGEADDIADISRVSDVILDKDRRPVRRGQHPKQHGCVRAEFTVEDDVPDDLKVGIFREPRSYPAWVRYSNGSQDDDGVGDIHGMAIKLMDVDGPKVLDDERNERTHDFVLMDHPVFFSRNCAEQPGTRRRDGAGIEAITVQGHHVLARTERQSAPRTSP